MEQIVIYKLNKKKT